MINCFNKTYRYLAYSNSVYTYLIGGKRVDDFMKDDEIALVDEDLETEKSKAA
jgi:hypothetical protein